MKKIILFAIILTEIAVAFAQTPNYQGIVYVTPTGAGTHSGDSWANATSALDTAQALAQANNCVVWVAAGVYYGDTASSAENAFTMVDGVDVYGGFAGTEPANFDLSLRDFETNETILDGDSARRVLYQPWNFSDTTVWDGFTIRNGYTSSNGGGIYLRSSVFLNHCNMYNNHADENGGGIYSGLWDNRHSSTIVNCIFTKNTASKDGAGIFMQGPTCASNCLIANNTAGRWGGGIYDDVYYSDVNTINNSTIVRNTALYGGGVDYTGYPPHLTNCIVWGNKKSNNGTIDNTTSKCSYTAIEEGCPGTGNITLMDTPPYEPLFVKPSLTAGAGDTTSNTDWHLQQESICINRGNNEFVFDSLDIDGTIRIKNGTVDIGCYESVHEGITLPEKRIVYVTPMGSGNYSGDSWGNAMSSIDKAQAIAQNHNAVVWIAAGTYYGDTLSNTPITMRGVNVYGSFAGNEQEDYDLSLRDFESNASILDGQNVRRGLYQKNCSSTPFCWDGFTIQNGYTTGNGGGVFLSENGSLNHCTIRNNRAGAGGGVLVNEYCTISNCKIHHNIADYGGGVQGWNYYTISNCVIYNNTALGESGGGGMYLTYYQDGSTIANNTIVRNYAERGGGIKFYMLGDNAKVIKNNIVWGNSSGFSSTLLPISYSAIEGGYPGTGNIALFEDSPFQPHFVNPSLTAGAEDTTSNVDWHLLPTSICINRGSNAMATDSVDLDGTARIKRDTVDMGCYESDYNSATISSTYSGIVYVTPTGAGTKNGDSWENAMSSIADAQGMAQNVNADVWVSAGTYLGDTLSGNAFTMYCVNVYGGFAGNEPSDYDLSLRDFENNVTLLDGDSARRVLYQPLDFSDTTIWDGFTISNGYTEYVSGGGVYLRKNGMIQHCQISNNKGYSGGGVYAQNNAIVSNCEISNNTATSGGGVSVSGNSSISNCNIHNNEAISDYDYGYNYGGGVVCYNSTISNCLISNNTSNYGGGIYVSDSLSLINTTIANNLSYNGGSGISTANSPYFINLTNCIIWNNDIYNSHDYGGIILCSYSAFEGVYAGEGNIDISNMEIFVNPSLTAGAEDTTANVDWHLQDGSVCINSGNNEYVLDSVDLDGTARIKWGTVDMGCYESDYNCATASDTTATACGSYSWHGYENLIESGDYMDTLVNVAGCDSIVTLHLTVNHGTHNVTDTTLCNGESFTWHDSTYTESGTYTYDYLNETDCPSTDTLHLTVETCDTTGLIHYDDNDITLYPNPTTGVVNVQYSMNNAQTNVVEIQVFDVYGRILDVVETFHETSLQIDLSHYANGIYVIKLVNGNRTIAMGKVVKQ